MDTAKKTQGTPRTAPQVSDSQDGAAPLTPEELAKLDAYWRASNYLAVGQIYLLDNPLLREPLKREHIKPRLLGHWGTSPGLNMLCVHLNRVIKRDDLNMIYIIGPGHGGPSLVAHAYLEGTRQRGRARLRAQEPGRTDRRPLEPRRSTEGGNRADHVHAVPTRGIGIRKERDHRDGCQSDQARFPPGCLRQDIGRSSPLGATVVDGGVNFSLFSRTAAGVELVFFDREDDATPSRVVRIDPATNRTYHYWHVVRARADAGTDLWLPGRGAV